MSAAANIQVAEPAETLSADRSGVHLLGTSLRPPTSAEIEAHQQRQIARRRRRKAASVMVFLLLGIGSGLSVFALTPIAAKIAVGVVGTVMLGVVAAAPSGRIDR